MRIIVILTVSVVTTLGKQLPKFMQDLRCPLTHDFKPCFIEKGNAAIPFLAKGVPEYNIPKMDPAEIKHVQLVSTPLLSLNLTGLKIFGLEKLKIVDIEVDLKRRMFRTTLSGANITVAGKYSVNGQILVLPIKSKGHFSVYLKNGIYIATKIDYIVERNGEKYYNPVFDPMDYHLEKVVFDIENLFGGNKELGASVNEFLNNNWDILMIEFGPEIAKIISKIITDIFDNLAAVVPVKYVFLDDPVFKFRK
ncbi:circadian clock-controlled protein daywake-like [Harmonia axyridis]|uniref:circadian clock-controlled protein daywake-like n=1 Tax=Harmonia axyridis TaxID=115357 RepID=UPI001E275A5B|nr:circadian clock-controlled protein daywake-like [Harmonia axyridis]